MLANRLFPIVLLVILTAPFVAGQAAVMKPEGQVETGPLEELKRLCDQEGQYLQVDPNNYQSLIGALQRVDWDTKTYCSTSGNSVCMPPFSTEWSAATQACCGAQRKREQLGYGNAGCGYRMGDQVCGSVDLNTWAWRNLTEDAAQIIDFTCANASLISDGQEFYACGDLTTLTAPPQRATFVGEGDYAPVYRAEKKGWAYDWSFLTTDKSLCERWDAYGAAQPDPFHCDGIVGYAYTSQQPGTDPLYRMKGNFNIGATRNPSRLSGWSNNGIIGYVYRDAGLTDLPLAPLLCNYYNWYYGGEMKCAPQYNQQGNTYGNSYEGIPAARQEGHLMLQPPISNPWAVPLYRMRYINIGPDPTQYGTECTHPHCFKYRFNRLRVPESTGTFPTYKNYDPIAAYATDPADINALITRGYAMEGNEGFVFLEQQSNTVPLYRLQRGSGNDARYRLTTSGGQRDQLLSQGWSDGGVLGYVYSQAQPGTVPLRALRPDQNWAYGSLPQQDRPTFYTTQGYLRNIASQNGWVDLGVIGHVPTSMPDRPKTLSGPGPGAGDYAAFTLVNVSKSGGKPHGYLCTEFAPQRADEYKQIIECRGDESRYSPTGIVATTGEHFTPSLRLQTSTVETAVFPVKHNINPAEGRVELEVEPAWGDQDTQQRVFFTLDEDPDASYLRVERSNGLLRCQYSIDGTTEEVTSDYPITADEPFAITLTWNASSFSCAMNNTIQTAPHGRTLSPSSLRLGDHANTGAPADARISVSIYDRVSPDTYYCVPNPRFLTNLDGEGPDGGAACRQAGLSWTGTLCCSEADDEHEYYNDPGNGTGGTGACWDSQTYYNGQRNNQNTTLVSQGYWYGCNLPEDSPLLDETDRHAGLPLVTNNQTCEAFLTTNATPEAGYYCSMRDVWKPIVSREAHLPKEALPVMLEAGGMQSECCPESGCWNGTQCVANQKFQSLDVTYAGQRCIEGQWQAAEPKWTWNQQNRGFCPQQFDCLVNPAGNTSLNGQPEAYVPVTKSVSGGRPDQPQGGPACLRDDQHILQYQCSEGEWNSRTLNNALHLIDYAVSGEGAGVQDYELFCGPWNNILNFVDYAAIENAAQVSTYVERTCMQNGGPIPCSNNFCALKYPSGTGERVALSVSLNTDVSSTNSILPAFGMASDACDGVKDGDNRYDLCTGQIYYNDQLNSILRVPTGSVPTRSTQSVRNQHRSKLEDHRDNLISFSQEQPHVRQRTDFFDQSSTVYDHLYLARKNGKDYFGYLGLYQHNGTPLHYIAIDHQQFNVQDIQGRNPCDMLGDSLRPRGKHTGTLRERDCRFTSGTFNYIGYTDGTRLKKQAIMRLWLDLTAKLRP